MAARRLLRRARSRAVWFTACDRCTVSFVDPDSPQSRIGPQDPVENVRLQFDRPARGSEHTTAHGTKSAVLPLAGLLRDSVLLRGVESCKLQRAPLGKLYNLQAAYYPSAWILPWSRSCRFSCGGQS